MSYGHAERTSHSSASSSRDEPIVRQPGYAGSEQLPVPVQGTGLAENQESGCRIYVRRLLRTGIWQLALQHRGLKPQLTSEGDRDRGALHEVLEATSPASASAVTAGEPVLVLGRGQRRPSPRRSPCNWLAAKDRRPPRRPGWSPSSRVHRPHQRRSVRSRRTTLKGRGRSPAERQRTRRRKRR